MKGFIRLHDRSSKMAVLLNPMQVVAISDLRSDPVVKGQERWQWTNVDCSNGARYQVRETEEEIIELLNELV